MPLLLLLLLGALTIAIGFWCRRNDPGGISVATAIKVVPIAFGLTLSVATGLVPSLYAAWGMGWAKLSGQPIDDVRPFLLPGTNVDDLVQSTVVATTLLSIIALVEYIRMCKGRKRS